VTAAGRFEAHVAVDGREFSYPFLVTATCRTPAETFGLEEKGTLARRSTHGPTGSVTETHRRQ
jgi:hypothetical protein